VLHIHHSKGLLNPVAEFPDDMLRQNRPWKEMEKRVIGKGIQKSLCEKSALVS
jgi:hypothetical protein